MAFTVIIVLTSTFLLLLIGLHVCAFSATYKALTLV